MEKMRILVVDDNTVNLATVEQELKDKYEVVPMLSGRRAIKYLYREKVDLILLDVQMPIMDGIETLKEIRTQENGVTVPVIFLTTKKDKLTVLEGAKLGIMDYITKPVDADELHDRIEKVFKRLGVLPMEEEELYNRLVDILSDIDNNRTKQAVFKMEEVLGYQIQDDVSGRMKNAKQKLETGDVEGAENMVARVIRMLEKNVASIGKMSSMPISTGEINARILYILDELENFKIKNAMAKIKELKRFDIPAYVVKVLDEAAEKLKDYDDEEAEKILRELLTDLKKPEVLRKAEKQDQGYHSSRLK
ncbi:MAG: PleD family two-component system response regulator [Lachnospiraceae bacterium]